MIMDWRNLKNRKLLPAFVGAAVLAVVVILLAGPYVLKIVTDKTMRTPAASKTESSNQGHTAQAVPDAAPAVTGKAESGHEGHTAAATTSASAAESQADQETPTIEIPTDKQQMIGIRTTEVELKPFRKVIRTVGKIDYDERRIATVNMKFEGWVEVLHVDYSGRYVRKGEPLVEIYSPELLATQREYLSIVKWSKQVKPEGEPGRMLTNDAQSMREAAKQRLRNWDISDAQIRRIEETGKTSKTLTLYSPVNGYVVQKMAIRGMRAMPGEKLFDIADLSSVWVIADIYEQELSLIKVNQAADISISSFPGKEFRSRIDYVYPTISGDTRTARARFTIPNPGGRLKPQMFANVEIKIDMGKKLAIPDSAVIDSGRRQVVYVDKGEGVFEPREVMLGITADGLREVLMGLKAGERVASSGTFLIDSEAQLKGVAPLGGHKH